MSISTPNSATTEGQFEAQVRAAILKAFPWLPATDITHQKSFTFRFGHASVTVHADEKSYARARADVLINFRGAPLAVFELKRPGAALTREDEEQGLSYARMLHPRPPLVVVSNGNDTQLLETHSGEKWQPVTQSEDALSALVRRSAEISTLDLKRAVEILMGPGTHIWTQAIRQVTAHNIEELTGGWGDPIAPFVRDFLLPRKATAYILKLLQERNRLTILQGGPLAGKSSTLRDLAARTVDREDIAILHLDADSGLDIFERLSMILTEALDWSLTPDEARRWLTFVSRASGPTLVLAIDNLGPDRDDLRRNIETLTSNLFGPALCLVVATDDTVADQITRQRSGRGASPLGRRAIRIGLGQLDNDEFELARVELSIQRMTFINGAHHSNELRAPWLIRAMAADAALADEYTHQNLVAALSPVPGLELIDYVRQTFDVSHAPFALYRELARAVLEDGQDSARSYELILEMLENFIIRRATTHKYVNDNEIRSLINSGLIREARSKSGENVYAIRLPELMASELAALVADELPLISRKDPVEAAGWLVGVASNLPLGDMIAAEALIDAAIRNRGLDMQVITVLLKRAPKRNIMAPGTRTSGWIQGIGIINMNLYDKGSVQFEWNGHKFTTEAEEGETEHVAFSDFHPYLILSHLAGHRLDAVGTDFTPTPRLDPQLLVTVGNTPYALRRPGGELEIASVPVHEDAQGNTVVCHRAGIVEPITWSLVRFLSREDKTMCEQFIDFALPQAQIGLIARLDIALRQVAGHANKVRAEWAQKVRHERLSPLVKSDFNVLDHD